MKQPLNVLMVEDSPDDALLLAFELRQSGFELTFTRVETEDQYRAELLKRPDVVLSDYSLPRWSRGYAHESAATNSCCRTCSAHTSARAARPARRSSTAATPGTTT